MVYLACAPSRSLGRPFRPAFWATQGQFVELRSVPLRIGNLESALDSGWTNLRGGSSVLAYTMV
jgi:hypothetical protein